MFHWMKLGFSVLVDLFCVNSGACICGIGWVPNCSFTVTDGRQLILFYRWAINMQFLMEKKRKMKMRREINATGWILLGFFQEPRNYFSLRISFCLFHLNTTHMVIDAYSSFVFFLDSWQVNMFIMRRESKLKHIELGKCTGIILWL